MQQHEDHENLLDPHREEARQAADREVTARLRSHGIVVPDGERSEDLADLLSAVERFEAIVEAKGGDLMVDDLRSSQPDNPQFVPPDRQKHEEARDYIRRIDQAADALRRHPARPG